MEKFNEIVSGQVPVLVDFFATWCGPCKAMGPILEELKKELGDRVRIVKLDIDKPANRPLVERYNIRSVPTLMVFRDGALVWQGAGARQTAELRKLIAG